LSRDDFLKLNDYESFRLPAQFGWNDRNQNAGLTPESFIAG